MIRTVSPRAYQSATGQEAATAEGQGATSDAQTAAAVQLIATYHQTARQELIARIGHRDAALFLYLTASAAIFGVAFGAASPSLSLLYVVPVFGLGAALINIQHNDVIGGIALYLGVEVDRKAKELLGDEKPPQWDAWKSGFDTTKRTIDERLGSGLLLIPGTQVAAIVIAGFEADTLTGAEFLAGSTLGVAAIAASVILLWKSQRRRRERQKMLLETLES